MRAIVTGGGSGGHIYPALAIADKIRERESDSEILYLGNDIGIEKDIVPETGYPFEMVAARWFEKKPVEIVKTAAAVVKGTKESVRHIRKFRPDVVVGTGGFVCVPVIRAAAKCGVPCFLLEENAYPGRANRFLEKRVDKVFLGFPDASKYFRQPEKHVYTGNPVRKRFYGIDREEARRTVGAKDGEFVVFAVAGSQGADHLNDVFFDFAREISGKPGVRFIFSVGLLHYQLMQERIRQEGVSFADNVVFLEYIKDMEHYLGGSDLVISRAGAMSVAENCVSGRAQILIPSPNVPGNHQYYNAKSVADRGGAVLLEEKDLTVERLRQEIRSLRDDPERLRKMEAGAREAAPVDASDRIYEALRPYAGGAGEGARENSHG